MATNFVQPGEVLTLVAPAEVDSGDVVAVGSFIGIAQGDAASGAAVDVQLVGVFTLPKPAVAINAGVAVYWDPVAGNVTPTAGSLTKIGICTETAADSAATCHVRLNGSF